MISSKKFHEKIDRSEFDSFRMKRKNQLLNNRSQFEKKLETVIKIVLDGLSEFYRYEILPQSSRFIKDYGLVYMDFLVRVICKEKTTGVSYGKKFCVELDEPYHDSKRQQWLDRGRENAILKKHPNIEIIRIKLNELNDQNNTLDLLARLEKSFDWF